MNLRKIYEDEQALLQGHFLLSSGKHSEFYLQSARVLEDPKTANLLASELAKKLKALHPKIDYVASPAIGGLIIGYALAQALNARFIFTERQNKQMTLRRGFDIPKNAKVIICEDIITTGKSAQECANVLRQKNAQILGFCAIANRGICKSFKTKQTKNECEIQEEVICLDEFVFELFEPQNCPLCKSSKAIKPGSR